MGERYRLRQHGIPVAWAEGANAAREIAHYAAVYSSDGPVEVDHRVGGRWKRISPDELRNRATGGAHVG